MHMAYFSQAAGKGSNRIAGLIENQKKWKEYFCRGGGGWHRSGMSDKQVSTASFLTKQSCIG